MKRILVGISLACMLCIPCYAIKSMMFNSVTQYVERTDGIWIIKVVKQSGHERTVGPTYEAKILQTLKGRPVKKNLTICAISRKLTARHIYLVFGFNRISTSEAWLDNGNVSPIPIPASFLLTDLKGKSVKKQIATIMTARCRELERLMKELAEEKAALEGGLEFQKRLNKLPLKAK